MLAHVGQGFLDDAQDLQLGTRRETEVGLQVEAAGDPVLGFPVGDELAQGIGGGLPRLGRAAQADDRLADIGVDLARRRGELGDRGVPGLLEARCGGMAATVREVQTLSMPVTMAQLLVFFLAAGSITRSSAPSCASRPPPS